MPPRVAVAVGRRGGRGLDSRQVGERRRRGGARAVPSVAMLARCGKNSRAWKTSRVRRRCVARVGSAPRSELPSTGRSRWRSRSSCRTGRRRAGGARSGADRASSGSRGGREPQHRRVARRGTARGTWRLEYPVAGSVRTTRSWSVRSTSSPSAMASSQSSTSSRIQAPAEVAHVPEYGADCVLLPTDGRPRAYRAVVLGEGRVRWT